MTPKTTKKKESKKGSNKNTSNIKSDKSVQDSSLKLLTEDITCPIHLGVLRNPVTLVPCGHPFCKNCIVYLTADGLK